MVSTMLDVARVSVGLFMAASTLLGLLGVLHLAGRVNLRGIFGPAAARERAWAIICLALWSLLISVPWMAGGSPTVVLVGAVVGLVPGVKAMIFLRRGSEKERGVDRRSRS
jgi:hypothetical protein